MSLIYNYHPVTGEYLGQAVANVSPREEDVLLVPAFAAVAAPPPVGERQCACYLDAAGLVPADYQDGAWHVVTDWRGVALWNKQYGDEVWITKPGQKPEDIGATDLPCPSAAYRWQGDGWQLDSELQTQLAAQAAVSKLADINAAAGRALAELSAGYPAGEIASWPQQTREAETIAANPEAAAPILSAIAQQRGIPVAELAQRVQAKVTAYGMASGYIIGQRQALEDAVEAVDLTAADALQQLEAITWPAA
ncbi:hypothetical protein ACFPAG_07950 [Vogesella sp. GCM10023246]|uniref:Tail fiber assembly protein n=1 Tax=Vogesella oryzagri TaxID=3160864 RepID=A0ABV1M2T6_9NEIS